MTLGVDINLNTMKQSTKIPGGKPESYQVAPGIPNYFFTSCWTEFSWKEQYFMTDVVFICQQVVE